MLSGSRCRNEEIQYLKELKNEEKSGFLYVRGRRRVGKSWLLKEFKNHCGKKECFYFSGVADLNNVETIERFIVEWELFTGFQTLSLYSHTQRTWDRIFTEISNYAKALRKTKKKFVLILDEIQWLAKERSGFAGILKQAWIDLEKVGNIKIIVCGSSSKFFHTKTGGEETILRGLQTKATLWVLPITLSEVKKYILPSWSLEEICLTYMMFGGIPYYLNQIDEKKGFIHAINTSTFLSSSIFLNEVEEILRLEFNKSGVHTVKKILSFMGQNGSSHKSLVEKTGFNLSRISETLEKLAEYNLVFEKIPAHESTKLNKAGSLFYMKDFYFQVILSRQELIKYNAKGLLFPYTAINSNKGYYIENFSGQAFELLIRSLLEDKRHLNLNIFKKLLLIDANYEVLDWWNKESQVDLIVEHKKDNISRIIECKWAYHEDKNWIEGVSHKKYAPPAKFKKMFVLVVSCKPSAAFLKQAKEKNVVVVTLEDLF
ncbi:MAG: ATP-binding protein [Bdellovibrionota bacterium]